MPLYLILAALVFLTAQAHAREKLPDDVAMIEGFNRVVFTAEISGPFSDSGYLKKFTRPVRFRVEQGAAIDRRAAVEAFVAEIGGSVAGLRTRMAGPAERADFTVHVVDRAQYQSIGRRIYSNPFMRVPGHCIVRANFSEKGIIRSDAIIVSDEGEPRFRRCLVEEVLQGLGPLADNPDAMQSVFNDRSRATTFTRYDRLMLNMLYDPRLKPGMRKGDAAPFLPAVLRDARRYVR
ncbi:DUF2927 domain-containing protein [Aureimonas populi]|uniref:DUF2927 domain-containing protein n=1 Tax=Aureimonas populi TaxID=1701758 RepID=A0ABW5CLF0_9HYPH|nr:DUF2927 domain-containing protein [Aureimonas populi]